MYTYIYIYIYIDLLLCRTNTRAVTKTEAASAAGLWPTSAAAKEPPSRNIRARVLLWNRWGPRKESQGRSRRAQAPKQPRKRPQNYQEDPRPAQLQAQIL